MVVIVRDIVYTDAHYTPIGVLQDAVVDLAVGKDENNFTLQTGKQLEHGALWFVDGGYEGGIIDGLRSVDGLRSYYGRSWIGILDSHVVTPGAHEDYLVLNGKAAQILWKLFDLTKLNATVPSPIGDTGAQVGSMFRVDQSHDQTSAKRIQFDRYCTLWEAVQKIMIVFNRQLVVSCENGAVVVRLNPQNVHRVTNGQGLEVAQSTGFCNHLIVLGKGELANREILHIYADSQGNVTETQTMFGVNEVCQTYDYSNSDNLRKDGLKKMRELLAVRQQCSFKVSDTDRYLLGDMVQAYSEEFNISVTATIEKIVFKHDKGVESYDYDMSYSAQAPAGILEL